MEAINLIKLSGIIAQEIKVKHTPAGIFSASFWLVHNSTQANNSNSGGFTKQALQRVKCSIQVIMHGNELEVISHDMCPGQEVVVLGYLNERNVKNDSFMVLHAQNIKIIDVLNL